ncbi:hypothetical protein [Sulfurimonas sp. RIFOXYB12_FULL_35_9]|uniref:hypothetical protein n=1 Tax=Sulfurimonas sp. RIFOXYB12_FULL_35_9 TaxID=1802256 RepID=UPI0025CE6F07|nr:hypothetical protein [Sulfurimonas sp. RIFOXYB12_FULL_35_9]
MGKIKNKKLDKSKVENFDDKVKNALSLLGNLKVSDEEKELLAMSLQTMSEFVVNYYGDKK